MAYNKHNFVNGQTLYAQDVNQIQEAIVRIEEEKLSIQQQSGNAGHFLTVSSDGRVIITGPKIDETLSQQGMIAEAKVVGEKLNAIKNELIAVQEDQPTDQNNRLWIQTGSIQQHSVPTREAFERLDNEVSQISANLDGIRSQYIGRYNVQDYGILPSNDAQTNTANWNDRLMIAWKDHRKNIYFPAGLYLGEFGINYKVLYPNGMTLADCDANTIIYGDGDQSILRMISDGETGILSFIGNVKDENGKANSERMVKNFIVRDLRIDAGAGLNTTAYKAAHRLLHLKAVQNFRLQNVKFFNTNEVAIYCEGAMDGDFTNLDLLRCGYPIDTDNSVMIRMVNDTEVNKSTNAIKFSNCRMEGTPKFMHIGGGSYSVKFVNCKFECGNNSAPSGGQVYSNVFGRRPIQLEECKDVAFIGCHFQYTIGWSSPEALTPIPSSNMYLPFISATNAASTYNSGNGIVFSGCDFSTNPRTAVCWFYGWRTTIIGCDINGCNGDFVAGDIERYAIRPENGCIIVNNRIHVASGNRVIYDGASNTVIGSNIIITGT